MPLTIRNLTTAFKRSFNPGFKLCDILEQSGIHPTNGFPRVSRTEIPCLAARSFLPRFHHDTCPVRSQFRDAALLEIPLSPRQVVLTDLEGSSASKTLISDFTIMSREKSIQAIAEQYRGDVAPLARHCLSGTRDCAVREGESASIFRQAWDGRQWLINSGGGHRIAALWLLDRENGVAREMNARVTEFRFSDRFTETCRAYSIFIFRPGSIHRLADHMHEMKRDGFILAPEKAVSSDCDWSLIVPKSHSAYADIKKVMAPAFDFADWVLNPVAYRSCEENFESGNPIPIPRGF